MTRKASRERLGIVHAALDIQRDRIAARIALVHTRASFILTADAVLLGLSAQATPTCFPAWLPLGASVVSAALAVVVLFGTRVKEPDIEATRKGTNRWRPDRVEFAVYTAKRISLESAQEYLHWRERVLQVGTVVLLIAMGLVLARGIFG